MLLIQHRATSTSATPSSSLGAATDTLLLPYEARCRSRQRVRLGSNQEAALILPPGSILRGGDLLLADDGRVVEVVASDEPLLEARCPDPLQLARAAWHLGNRHVPVELGEGWLRLAPDPVLAGLLERLGLPVREISAPFEPEGGAYSHAP